MTHPTPVEGVCSSPDDGTSIPAVPYVECAALPEEYRYIYDDNENGGLNVYRALGNDPEVLQSLTRRERPSSPPRGSPAPTRRS